MEDYQAKQDKVIADVKTALAAKGVRLKTSGCGCCNSPWVKIEVDGVLVADEDGFYLNMFEEGH